MSVNMSTKLAANRMVPRIRLVDGKFKPEIVRQVKFYRDTDWSDLVTRDFTPENIEIMRSSKYYDNSNPISNSLKETHAHA